MSPTAKRPARRLLWGLAALVLAGGAGLAALWLAQDRLLAWGLHRLEAASEGRLSTQGVSVDPIRGARIARLRWHDPKGWRVDARGLRLEWRWVAALQGRWALARVQVGEIDLVAPSDETPATLPGSLGLPFPVDVESLRVERLRWHAGAGALASVQEWRTLAFKGGYAPGGYRVERLSGDSPWGPIALAGRLSDQPPFEVDARAAARLSWQSLGVTLTARGSLSSMVLNAHLAPTAAVPKGGVVTDARVPTATLSPPASAGPLPAPPAAGPWLRGSVTLAPFASAPLGPITLQARDVGAPWLGLPADRRLRLDGEGELRWRGAGPSGGLTARLDLRNREPAPWDLGGVPVSQARGTVHWAAGRWHIADLHALDTGSPQGVVSGELWVVPGEATQTPWGSFPVTRARLALASVDVARWDTRVPPTALSGEVRLDARHVLADLTDRARAGAALRLAADWRGDRLVIDTASLRAPPGQPGATLNAKGSVQVVHPWSIELEGQASRLDLAAAGRTAGLALQGTVDGQWTVSGAIGREARERRLAFDASVSRGEVQGQSIEGTARARWVGDRLEDIEARWRVGPNRVSLTGAVGAPADRLVFDLDAPAPGPLAALVGWPALQGSLRATGHWHGGGTPVAGAIELKAPRLAGEGWSVVDLALTGEWTERALLAKAEAARAVLAGQAAQALSVRAEGTPTAHRLQVEGRRAAQRLVAALAGGWAQGRWSGELLSLRLDGPVSARLREATTLNVRSDAVTLGPAQLEGELGQVRLTGARWREDGWSIGGQASLKGLARLAEAFGLERPPMPADVDPDAVRLDLVADLSGQRGALLEGTLVASMTPPPGLNGTLQADLTLRSGRLGGRVDLDLPTLAVANRWIGPAWSVEGRLRLSGSVSGTPSAPQLSGDVIGEGLRLEDRSLGWRLGAGTLQARFEGDRLRVQRLRLYSGQAAIDAAGALKGASPADTPDGSIELDGDVRLAERGGRFRLKARGAAIPFGPGQRVVVSGDAEVSSVAGRFDLKGRLRADEGLIELKGGDAPVLPDDVEIVGPTTARGGTVATPAPTAGGASNGSGTRPARGGDAGLRLVSDLTIDLGEKLRVRGSGVDARLTGTVTLSGTLPDAPRAQGTVRVREGTYTAYGQRLEIERGRVVFNGPLDNPLLDLVALRRQLPVEAGVSVTGTVLQPRVRLTSRPEVPDAEKLSWLVLGVPLDSAQTGAQAAALQAAAATLFGGNDGGLMRALGLDVLTVRAAGSGDALASAPGLSGLSSGALVPGQVGSTTTTASTTGVAPSVVAIGKRLNSRLLLTYEQGLRGVWNLLRIQYDITSRLSLRAQTGSESALDVLYRFSFD